MNSSFYNKKFNGTVDDRPVRLFTLQNQNGLTAQFTNYGARWVSMFTPDRKGTFADVLLGFDTFEGYLNAGEQYHGAIVGRVCGRIQDASFTLNKKHYNLAANDAYGAPIRNHLHGGIRGFHRVVWNSELSSTPEGEESIIFSYLSPDREEGYPGTLRVTATYTLKQNNVLELICTAVTDQPTYVNLTNHAFFNLSGNMERPAINHLLTLNASSLIACNRHLLPTGKLIKVKGTSLDFTVPRTIAGTLIQPHSQMQSPKGYSLAYALNTTSDATTFAARLEDKPSGRCMEIYTNQPSLQLYTGYFMDGTDIGKYQIPYHSTSGIALEPQGYPDAPHHPEFPSILLQPGQKYEYREEVYFKTTSRFN